MNKNEKQKQYRIVTKNKATQKYEKTPKGFLVRTYRNMLSRVTGVQKNKAHLYKGKPILNKHTFYVWALTDKNFLELFKVWEGSNYSRKLTPSIDRIDPAHGYTLDNVRWLTHSENSRRGGRHKPT